MSLEEYKQLFKLHLSLKQKIKEHLSSDDFQILDIKERKIILDIGGKEKELNIFSLIKGKT